MGFNLIRFALDPQYRAIKRWKRDKGDERLLLDVPLDGNSLVIDAGFYRGSFATRCLGPWMRQGARLRTGSRVLRGRA